MENPLLIHLYTWTYCHGYCRLHFACSIATGRKNLHAAWKAYAADMVYRLFTVIWEDAIEPRPNLFERLLKSCNA